MRGPDFHVTERIGLRCAAAIACLLGWAQPVVGVDLVTRESVVIPAGVEPVRTTISPDLNRAAYVISRDNKRFLVVDGVEGKGYDDIDSIAFSPDGKRLAYRAKKGKRLCVVVDGVEGKEYDYIPQANSELEKSVEFSPDSQHAVYFALDGEKKLEVLDGVERKAWDISTRLYFSADSKHVGYKVDPWHGLEVWVVDGVIDGRPDLIMTAPRGRRTVKPGRHGDKFFVAIDGVEGNSYREPVSGLAFSPDGERVVWVAPVEGGRAVVIDGVEGKAYSKVERVRFSPDSKHILYTAKDGDVSRVVLDGEELKGLEGAPTGPPVFSPDSRRLACVVRRGEKEYVVVNGKPGPEYDCVARMGGWNGTEAPQEVVFSPDSKHVAYLGQKGETWRIVVDGVETKEAYERFAVPLGLTWSWKWKVTRANPTGFLVREYRNPYAVIVFDSPDTLHTIAVGNRRLVRVEVRIAGE